MEFFIDTADVKEIREAMQLGLADGVTTNPSLIAKAGRPKSELMQEIVSACPGPISLEVVATELKEMMTEAFEIASLGGNVVVKLPMTLAGLQVARKCREEGIKTNVTLCFSANQALLAAKAGATYVSPFVGRLDDISYDGMQLIREIKTIYDHYDFDTKILVASIRHPIHLKEAAMIGADVATIPYSTLQKLVAHPLTQRGLEIFLRDAAATENRAN